MPPGAGTARDPSPTGGRRRSSPGASRRRRRTMSPRSANRPGTDRSTMDPCRLCLTGFVLRKCTPPGGEGFGVGSIIAHPWCQKAPGPRNGPFSRKIGLIGRHWGQNPTRGAKRTCEFGSAGVFQGGPPAPAIGGALPLLPACLFFGSFALNRWRS